MKLVNVHSANRLRYAYIKAVIACYELYKIKNTIAIQTLKITYISTNPKSIHLYVYERNIF